MKKIITLFVLAVIFITMQACRKENGVANIPAGTTAYSLTALKLPNYFPPLNIPADNPLTVQGVQLGRMLFYDPILSSDSTKSCFSCHAQTYSFTDHNNRFSTGVTGVLGTRNALPLMNLAFRSSIGFFWDGRAATLEDEAIQPVIDPLELHENWDHVVQKLQRSSFYPALFKKAFGTSVVSQDNAVNAIAQFERTLISCNSPFDKYLATNNPSNIPDSVYMGYIIFLQDPIIDPNTLTQTATGGSCYHCHQQPVFQNIENSAEAYANNGLDSVASIYDFPDPGRGAIDGDSADYGKFLIPSLRNVALTAPYMHDGRFSTLEQVLNHYSTGIKPSPTKYPLISNLHLSNVEKRQLLAFLNSLTDTSFVNNPAYTNPFLK